MENKDNKKPEEIVNNDKSKINAVDVKKNVNLNNMDNIEGTVSEFCDMKNIRDMIKHIGVTKFGNVDKKKFSEWKQLFTDNKIMDFSEKIYFKN